MYFQKNLSTDLAEPLEVFIRRVLRGFELHGGEMNKNVVHARLVKDIADVNINLKEEEKTIHLRSHKRKMNQLITRKA